VKYFYKILLVLILVDPLFLFAGLAQVKDNSENLILFSTSKNSQALDTISGSTHSPFAKALIKSLQNKKLTLGGVVEKTIEETSTATSYSQVPSVTSNFKDTQFRFSKLSARENRFALLIANANYQGLPLRSPINDAVVLKEVLLKQGFDVEILTNANYSKMAQTIKKFSEKLTSDSISFFFYSGHGFQYNGNNYLLPLNANVLRERDIPINTINLEDITSRLSLSKSSKNILMIDTSRGEYTFSINAKDIPTKIEIQENETEVIKESLLKEKPYVVDELIKKIIMSPQNQTT